MPVALGIQHTMRMRRNIWSCVSCPALPHFYTLSHKGQYFFLKKVLEQKLCVSIFSTKGYKTVPGKVAPTRTEDGHKQNTKNTYYVINQKDEGT